MLDYKAICCFAATGFFLEDDTYFIDQKALDPNPFQWHYAPRSLSFSQAVDEFSQLFEQITQEQIQDKKVILPLSGGLDSRSQAAALKGRGNVFTYSYQFDHSFQETKYGREIAKQMGWPFRAYTIPSGYLWDALDTLSNWNNCYAEFTAPRQMALTNDFPNMGELFFLGHGGDLLFNDMGVPESLPFDRQVEVVLKKIVKKSGWELAEALWRAWQLEGTFRAYFTERIRTLLGAIDIDNANARIRAFKSMYWVPRWTRVNLCVFEQFHPIALPYCDARMWQFICTVPEAYLAGRQIQIEYIKRKAPELAKIPWQSYAPCNLYNYNEYASFPIQTKVFLEKVRRRAGEWTTRRRCVERNWELQYLGRDNDYKLRNIIFTNMSSNDVIPNELVRSFYELFANGDYNNKIYYAHSISMLLTMSVFLRKWGPNV